MRDIERLRRVSRTQAVGAFLRNRRAATGSTVREVAAEVGVHHAQIVRLERGLTHDVPDKSRLETLADAYGLSPSERDVLLELGGVITVKTAEVDRRLEIFQDSDFLAQLLEDATQAAGSGDVVKAALYARRVAATAAEGEVHDRLRFTANLLLSQVGLLMGTNEQALRDLAAAREAAIGLADPILVHSATHQLAKVLHKFRYEDAALELYSEVVGAYGSIRRSVEDEARLARDVDAVLVNLGHFEEANSDLSERMREAERSGDLHRVLDFGEMYSRSLATGLQLREARGHIYALWALTHGEAAVTPLERVRLLVILFKVHALSGENAKASDYFWQIIRTIEQHRLDGQLLCLTSIGKEVRQHTGDRTWLKMAVDAAQTVRAAQPAG